MARTGRPKAESVFTDGEREQLVGWSRRASSAQALALRSRIVLACADGVDNKAVAAGLGCAEATVGKWRRRFVTGRLDGLVCGLLAREAAGVWLGQSRGFPGYIDRSDLS